MLRIEEAFIDKNQFSRPGKARPCTLGIVMHWTANPNASAMQNREYFDSKKMGMDGYGSAHYIVGQEGQVVQCMPDNEVAYHCGSSDKDPKSGKVYTDYAREKFGKYAIDFEKTSPNWCTVGIEMCPLDWEGRFSAETLDSAAELAASLVKKYGLSVESICTHKMVVGWKDCPKLWSDEPSLFDSFLALVAEKAGEKEDKKEEVKEESSNEQGKASPFHVLLGAFSLVWRSICGGS